MQMQIAATEI